MHLQLLKIKNLASLRGEHEVDFEVLGAQDLFAITGETGAGKSTLLNAIALALYGRVYRSQTYSTDYVTLGEKDAQVELYFSVRGVRYWVKWSITALKRDGTPVAKPKPNRSVYKFEQGEYRIQEVDPQDILGLDFDQFSKCVVLNQGEFARFLTSTFSERRGILEKLYPSDNLDAVGGLARKRFEREAERLKTIEIQMHGLTSETLFDVTAAREQLEVHKKAYQDAEAKLQKMRPWKQGLEELVGLAQKFDDAHARLRHLELELAQRTDVFNAAMTAWQQQQKALELSQAKYDQDLPELERDDREARALLPLATALSEKTKTLADEVARGEKLQLRLATQATETKTLTEQLTALAAQLTPQSQELLRCDWRSLEALQAEGPLLEQRARALDQELADATARGKHVADVVRGLDEKVAALDSTLPSALKELSAEERKAQLASAREALTRQELLSAQRARLASESQRLKTEIEAAAPRLTELTLRRENLRLQRALQELRQHLRHAPSAECPLCAQAVADWSPRLVPAATSETFDDASFEAELRAQEKRQTLVQQLATDLAALTAAPVTMSAAQVAECTATLEELARCSQDRRSQEARLAEARQQWGQLQERRQQLEQDRTRFEARQQQLLGDLSQRLGRELRWTPELYDTLAREREQAQRQSELERISTQAQQQLVAWQRELAENSQKRDRLRTELVALEAEVRTRQAALTTKYPQSSALEVMKQRQEELRLLQHRTQLLHQEFRQKELALADARSNLARVQEQLQQIELFFADQRSRLAQHRAIAVTIADARTVLPPLILSIAHDIAQEELKGREADLARGQLATLLSEDQKRREKLALLGQQRDLAAKESERWQRLLDVLGTDDLRTYVLALVEAALVEQTNVELQRLCNGRYEIQHSQRRDRPEFWVIDRWRDGLVRKVTTLSGGETFMVSLAMALALAEMARGRADIDCFFIDEGFGTLDEASLEDVMEMLQQVRSRGKQIGIITHVKALSSRLPLNLVVSKNARGNSSLEVVFA